MSYEPITVGELRAHLKGLNDSDKIHLPGELSFNELRHRGGNEYIILVNEPEAYLREDFKERNPHVKVAFIRADNIKWDKTGIVGGPIDVEIR